MTNPRVLAWLRAMNLDECAITRLVEDDDVTRLMIDGDELPWTIHFSMWIQARWREWAGTLGYSTKGLTPWDAALADGHTHEEFDAWLNAWTPVLSALEAMRKAEDEDDGLQK